MINEQIPINSIKNSVILENDLSKIKCSLCKGVLCEPICSSKSYFCRKCFFSSKTPKNNFKTLTKEIKTELNRYKYTCPNFDYEENSDLKEYTYDDLMTHMITCDNNKISCPYCGDETLIKKLGISYKDKLIKTLIENKILQKELDYQKSLVIEMEKKVKEEKENKNIIQHINKEKNDIKINPIKIVPVKFERKQTKSKTNIKPMKLPPIKPNVKRNDKKRSIINNFYADKITNKIEKPKTVMDNSKNVNIFNKCPHFYGNYLPKFACCGKFYGCYLCHNEHENHMYIFSNKVLCLYCRNVYAGKECTKCKGNQIFLRKIR